MTSKHENFVRLAEARVNKALEAIRLVGNLANRNNYEYSDAESRAIVAALSTALGELKSQFTRGEFDSNRAFKLPSQPNHERRI